MTLFAIVPLDNLVGNPVVLATLAAAAAFMGGKLLFRRDERIEERREKAFDLSQDCAKEGLGFLVPFLRAYAVGDYSGLIHELKSLASSLRDEDARRGALDKIVNTQVAKRMQDPERRDALLKLIAQNDKQSASTPAVTTPPTTAPPQ